MIIINYNYYIDVLKLWFGVSKDILPVKYFHFNKASFLYKSNFMNIIGLTKVEVNLAATGFNTVVYACHSS